MKKYFILVVFIFLLIGLSSANLNIDYVNITSTSLIWGWNETPIQSISIDGMNVYNLDIYSRNFTLSGLNPDEYHTIKIYQTSIYNVTNTSKTASYALSKSGSESVYDFIFSYIWLIAAVICIAIAAYSKNKYIAYLAVLVGFIGFLKGISDKSFFGYFLNLMVIIVAYFASERE